MRTAAAIGVLGALAAGGLAGWDFAHEARRAASLDEALVASLRDLLVAGAIAAASLCLGLGWTYRVGRRPHCARCGYERVESDRLIPCCPECGSPWRWIGWSVPGRPVSRPGMVSLGTLLGLGSLLVSAVLAAEPRAAWHIAPEPVLVQQAAAMPWYAALEGWREVRRRRLSSSAEDWLARRLVAAQARGEVLCPEAEAWLAAWSKRQAPK